VPPVLIRVTGEPAGDGEAGGVPADRMISHDDVFLCESAGI
jgi:hypothetical protein